MATTAGRAGNKRGFGSNLREEIVSAASRLLEESGSRETVTLRAIAREAGIAAPSIYPHFSDRDAILDVVVTRTFETLGAHCAAALDLSKPGREQVEAISAAYVAFAREQPGLYRILFERSAANTAASPHPYAAGTRAFDVLIGAVTRASTVAADPQTVVRDAQTLFAALHGIAVLRPALPGFPWQSETALVHNAVASICS